jgi:hypothetical protein
MPDFIITAPNGKKYKVTGPNKEGALQALKRQLGDGGPPPDASGRSDELSAMLPSASTDTTAGQAQREYDALPGWAKPLQMADDLAVQFGSGATMGLAEKGIANLKAAVKGTTYEQERGQIDKMIEKSRARSGIPGMAANIAGAIVTPAKLAKIGVTATRIPKVGAGLGLAADGAVIGGLTAYGNDQDIGTGAAIGGAAGAAGQALVSGASKLITPFKAPPARTQAAKALKREGIDVSAGQAVGNKGLLYRESEMGGNAMQDFAERQGEQLTGAALKRAGIDANRATPEVLDQAFTRIGNQFDNLASQTTILPDESLLRDITETAVDYAGKVGPGMRVGMIERTANDVIGLLQQGQMAGPVFKTLRSALSKFSRETTQPEAKEAALNFINALDDAVERSNPAIAPAWREVRNQYRNMLVLEQAATAAGSTAREGILSPAALRAATVSKQGRRNFARGKGDFSDLARNAELVMTKVPDSGTSSRLGARLLPQMVGIGAGGAFGGYQGGDINSAVMGAMAGAAAPYAMGKMTMSGPGQAYLRNQLLGGVTPEMERAAARAISSGAMPQLLGYQ